MQKWHTLLNDLAPLYVALYVSLRRVFVASLLALLSTSADPLFVLADSTDIRKIMAKYRTAKTRASHADPINTLDALNI